MTDKEKQLDHINDMCIEDVLETSDEEIRQEVEEETGNAEAEATRLRSLVGDAVHNHKKAKFEAAKKARLEQQQNPERNLKVVSLDRKKEIIKSLNSNDNFAQKITMAARNENELSESDLDVYLKHLIELGVIDEEGNILCDDD